MKVQAPSYSSPATVSSTTESSPAPNPAQAVPETQAANQVQKPNGKDQDTAERKDLEKVVDQMNKTLEVYNYDLKFEIVDKHRIVISIINTSTGEVLKQIPPEDLVKSFKQMDAFLGMLVDRKV